MSGDMKNGLQNLLNENTTEHGDGHVHKHPDHKHKEALRQQEHDL